MQKLKLWLSFAIWMVILSTQGLAGSWTDNGFFFKPQMGARGAEEKGLFDSGIDRLDARLGKEIWVGDPKYGSTLQSAIPALGAVNAILRVPGGAHPISDNLTIPANLTLKPERGAIFAIADGKTLTINGSLEAGLYQIFSCTGTGKVAGKAKTLYVYPEWWGAVGDGVADDTVPLQAAWDFVVQAGQGTVMCTQNYHTTAEMTAASLEEWTGWIGVGTSNNCNVTLLGTEDGPWFKSTYGYKGTHWNMMLANVPLRYSRKISQHGDYAAGVLEVGSIRTYADARSEFSDIRISAVPREYEELMIDTATGVDITATATDAQKRQVQYRYGRGSSQVIINRGSATNSNGIQLRRDWNFQPTTLSRDGTPVTGDCSLWYIGFGTTATPFPAPHTDKYIPSDDLLITYGPNHVNAAKIRLTMPDLGTGTVPTMPSLTPWKTGMTINGPTLWDIRQGSDPTVQLDGVLIQGDGASDAAAKLFRVKEGPRDMFYVRPWANNDADKKGSVYWWRPWRNPKTTTLAGGAITLKADQNCTYMTVTGNTATDITGFTNGYHQLGQEVTVVFTGTGATLKHGAALALLNGVDFNPVKNPTVMKFICTDEATSTFAEVSRSADAS